LRELILLFSNGNSDARYEFCFGISCNDPLPARRNQVIEKLIRFRDCCNFERGNGAAILRGRANLLDIPPVVSGASPKFEGESLRLFFLRPRIEPLPAGLWFQHTRRIGDVNAHLLKEVSVIREIVVIGPYR
jgi:hypothetical protein